MENQIENSLFRVSTEVLEKLAFMFSFPEEDPEEIAPETQVVASVDFSGPVNGRLVLGVSTNILPELSSNMLGIDDEPTAEEQFDALKELLNVICGNLLPVIAGKKIVFNVEAPVVHQQGDMGIPENMPKAASVRLDIEDEPCDISLFMDGDIPGED